MSTKEEKEVLKIRDLIWTTWAHGCIDGFNVRWSGIHELDAILNALKNGDWVSGKMLLVRSGQHIAKNESLVERDGNLIRWGDGFMSEFMHKMKIGKFKF